MLFNSGVGYFQRAGLVDGDARVDLPFQSGDINDFIKSCVIDDPKGKTLPPRYDSQEPAEKTLRSFAIDLGANPSYGEILNQARGEKVELTLAANTVGLPGSIQGTIVGMESGPPVAYAYCHGNRRRGSGQLALRRGTPRRSPESNSTLAVPESVSRERNAPGTLAGSSGERARQPEEVCPARFPRRRQTRGQGRLRRGKPHLENQLSRHDGQRGQDPAARLGPGRKHQRRGLERRQANAGVEPADFIPDGPLSAALCPTSNRRAGTVRFVAPADLRRTID